MTTASIAEQITGHDPHHRTTRWEVLPTAFAREQAVLAAEACRTAPRGPDADTVSVDVDHLVVWTGVHRDSPPDPNRRDPRPRSTALAFSHLFGAKGA